MIKKISVITIFILVFTVFVNSVKASTSTDENVTINGYLTFTSGALNMTATSGALSLSGLLASSISTGVNALTITSGNWSVDSNGTLTVITTDGTLTVGQAFPNRSASTDNGIGMFNAPASVAFKSGLFTEVNGELLSYGINISQIGDRDTTRTGGIFRMDTRATSPYFSVKRQAIGGSTEFSDIQISQVGDVGLGGWASDTNSFPGNVSLLVRGAAIPGLVVRGAAAQTANLAEWQINAGTIMTSITSAGALRIGTTGTPITNHLSATGAIDFGAVDGSCVTNAATFNAVTGAAVGDTVIATPTPVAGGIETGTDTTWMAWVSAANVVTVRVCDTDAAGFAFNPAAQTWRADVWKH